LLPRSRPSQRPPQDLEEGVPRHGITARAGLASSDARPLPRRAWR
jgi:hypothetical protein